MARKHGPLHFSAMIENLTLLHAHQRWADLRTFEAYRSLAQPQERALAWIAHIAAAQHLWLSRINGTTPRVAVWPGLDIDSCERLAQENHDAFDALLSSIDEHDTTRTVAYVNSRGDRFESTVGDILLHVAMHSQYHRGQVAAAVRAGGGVPTATDYIAWRRGEPLR